MKLKKYVTSLVLCGAIIGGGASAVFANTYYVGGGKWEEGVSNGIVYSDYHHNTAVHRSSVWGKTYNNSGWTSPGMWSYASAVSSGSDATYWDKK